MLALGVFDTSIPYQKRHRIRICSRHRRPDVTAVEVRGGPERFPYFAGFQMCGSVWVCPVCAAKIQAVRAQTVREHYIDAWLDQGGEVWMVGPTVPHTRTDALAALLAGYTDALARYGRGAAVTRFRKSIGFVGSIRALEVTFGHDTGWHPHGHLLWFTEAGQDQVELKERGFALWNAAAEKAGFTGLSSRAFSVQDASGVKTYLTKLGTEYQWNAEHELVKSHTKKARAGRYSPFDLLAANLEQSRPELLGRFREFADAFHGRRQLVRSRGLRELLEAPEERSDEQVAASLGELDLVLATIDPIDVPLIRRHGIQGEVLETVYRHGAEGLRHLMTHYRSLKTRQ